MTKKNKNTFPFDGLTIIACILLILGIAIGIVGYLYVRNDVILIRIMEDFYANISIELISISITVIVIGYFAFKRNEKLRIEELIDDINSSSNEIAKNAVGKLEKKGVFNTNKVEEKDFSRANLKNINFYDPDNKKVNFKGCTFNRTNLNNCRFDNIILNGTELQGTILTNSKFFNTNLQSSNFLSI